MFFCFICSATSFIYIIYYILSLYYLFKINYIVMIIILYTLLYLVATSEILTSDSLAVTIYNNGFGVVKDVRNIKFDKGKSNLYFTDVAENIQTQTVTFKALNNTQSIRVYEQNFQRNLITQDELLKRYIQMKIDVVADFGNEAKRVTGILLAYSPNVILKTDRGIISVNKISAFDVDSVPEDFFTKPTLNWKVYSQIAQTQKCELAYRTTGFQWKSDYILTVNEKETQADFAGWVTIDNNSGKKYKDAKLKLIAGDVNTISNSTSPNYQIEYDSIYEKSAPSFSQKSFSDYHMYTLSQPVTLNQSSQKQIQFIPKVYRIPIRKYNQLQITANGYNQNKLKATNKIIFKNSKDVGLGIALPKGTVRVFKQDEADKSLQFIGEDSIDHTPKDQNVTLTIGKAFDIVADVYAVNRTAFDSKGSYRATMNMTITNHKDIPAQIQVKISKYYGDNISIDWDPSNSATLQVVSANELKLVQLLKPNENVVYKWVENYHAP